MTTKQWNIKALVVLALSLLSAASPASSACTSRDIYQIFDFSHLNTGPISSFIVQQDGQFSQVVAEHMVPIRFWGVNIVAPDILGKEDLTKLSNQLSSHAVNLVRLHNFDSPTNVVSSRSILNLDGRYPSFREQRLRHLRQLTDSLAQAGIYTALSLTNGYRFTFDELGLSNSNERVSRREGKAAPFISPIARTLQRQYFQKVLSSLEVDSNPSIAMVEISNEFSLTNELDTRGTDLFIKGNLSRLFSEAFNSYAQIHKGNAPKELSNALESKEWRSTFREFLFKLDSDYFREMQFYIKSIARRSIPISYTQTNFMPNGFSASNEESYVDAHNYLNHYEFSKRKWDGLGCEIDSSTSAPDILKFLDATNKLKISSKAFSISEVSLPWPDQWSGAFPVILGAYGLAHNWSAITYFAWSNGNPLNSPPGAGFSISGDCNRLALFALGGYIFRSSNSSSISIEAIDRSALSVRAGESLRFIFGTHFSDLRAGPVSAFSNLNPLGPHTFVEFNSADTTYVGFFGRPGVAFQANETWNPVSALVCGVQLGPIASKSTVDVFSGFLGAESFSPIFRGDVKISSKRAANITQRRSDGFELVTPLSPNLPTEFSLRDLTFRGFNWLVISPTPRSIDQ